MKVLLYCDVHDKTVSYDTLRAVEARVRVLAAANIPYTLNPHDDYDIMEINPAYILNPFPISEARRKGAAVVVNAHYVRKDRAGGIAFSEKGDKVLRPVLSALLQKNDTLVVPSEYSAQQLKDLGIKNNIVSIPRSIITESSSRIQRNIRAFKSFFSINGQRVAVGLGPMTKENGFEDFIFLAKRLPQHRFVWIGGVHASEAISPISAALLEEIPSNMNCIRLVSQEILWGALAGADTVLFLSEDTAVYTDVIQTMALGGLCILRNQPVYAEFAKERDNCIIADDLEDFYSKVEYYIEVGGEKIRQSAKQLGTSYNADSIGERYRKLYSDVMSELVVNRIESYAALHERPGALNIGLFSETYPPDVNGVAVSVRTLRNQLLAMGHNVYVITPASDTKLFGVEFNSGILRIPAIKLEKLYGYRIGQPLSASALNYIKKMKLHVVHNNGEVSMRILAEMTAKLYGIPMVYTYHTMIEDYTHYVDKSGYFEDAAKRIVNGYTRRMSEHYNRIIAPTEKTEKALLRFGVKKPIDIIPTGIDTQRFRPENIDSEKLSEIKKSLGIDNCFTLCYVGRLAPEKNVSFILDNIKQASDIVGGLKFVITGYGPSEEDLRAQVRELGLESIVVFAGKQKPDEIQYYFALGDAFVTASTSETQGLTYIEAMGAGVPVIARFDECLSNVLIQDVTGFEFTDDNSFVKAVVAFKNFSSERREALKKNVLAKAEEYSLENFGANIIESYTAAIRNKRAENKIY